MTDIKSYYTPSPEDIYSSPSHHHQINTSKYHHHHHNIGFTTPGGTSDATSSTNSTTNTMINSNNHHHHHTNSNNNNNDGLSGGIGGVASFGSLINLSSLSSEIHKRDTIPLKKELIFEQHNGHSNNSFTDSFINNNTNNNNNNNYLTSPLLPSQSTLTTTTTTTSNTQSNSTTTSSNNASSSTNNSRYLDIIPTYNMSGSNNNNNNNSSSSSSSSTTNSTGNSLSSSTNNSSSNLMKPQQINYQPPLQYQPQLIQTMQPQQQQPPMLSDSVESTSDYNYELYLSTLILNCTKCNNFVNIDIDRFLESGITVLPGPDDKSYEFKCSSCFKGGNSFYFKHSSKTWKEMIHTSLFNLEREKKYRFSHYREVISYVYKHPQFLLSDREKEIGKMKNVITATLSYNRKIFVSFARDSGMWSNYRSGDLVLEDDRGLLTWKENSFKEKKTRGPDMFRLECKVCSNNSTFDCNDLEGSNVLPGPMDSRFEFTCQSCNITKRPKLAHQSKSWKEVAHTALYNLEREKKYRFSHQIEIASYVKEHPESFSFNREIDNIKNRLSTVLSRYKKAFTSIGRYTGMWSNYRDGDEDLQELEFDEDSDSDESTNNNNISNDGMDSSSSSTSSTPSHTSASSSKKKNKLTNSTNGRNTLDGSTGGNSKLATQRRMSGGQLPTPTMSPVSSGHNHQLNQQQHIQQQHIKSPTHQIANMFSMTSMSTPKQSPLNNTNNPNNMMYGTSRTILSNPCATSPNNFMVSPVMDQNQLPYVNINSQQQQQQQPQQFSILSSPKLSPDSSSTTPLLNNSPNFNTVFPSPTMYPAQPGFGIHMNNNNNTYQPGNNNKRGDTPSVVTGDCHLCRKYKSAFRCRSNQYCSKVFCQDCLTEMYPNLLPKPNSNDWSCPSCLSAMNNNNNHHGYGNSNLMFLSGPPSSIYNNGNIQSPPQMQINSNMNKYNSMQQHQQQQPPHQQQIQMQHQQHQQQQPPQHLQHQQQQHQQQTKKMAPGDDMIGKTTSKRLLEKDINVKPTNGYGTNSNQHGMFSLDYSVSSPPSTSSTSSFQSKDMIKRIRMDDHQSTSSSSSSFQTSPLLMNQNDSYSNNNNSNYYSINNGNNSSGPRYMSSPSSFTNSNTNSGGGVYGTSSFTMNSPMNNNNNTNSSIPFPNLSNLNNPNPSLPPIPNFHSLQSQTLLSQSPFQINNNSNNNNSNSAKSISPETSKLNQLYMNQKLYGYQ